MTHLAQPLRFIVLFVSLLFSAHMSIALGPSPDLLVNAGNDTTLILPNNSLTFSPSATSLTGTITGYSWAKISGPASFTLTDNTSPNAIVSDLVEGAYAFALTVTDDQSNVTLDTIQLFVGTRFLIDFGPTQVTSPNLNGNYWNNVTSAANGVSLRNARTTANTPSPVGLEITERIDGTFNTFNTGLNTGNTTGVVGEYPAEVTTDHAFADLTSGTSGTWKLFGLDANKTYTVKFWGSRTGVVSSITQVKRADEATWQTYEAANNTDFNNAAVFTFTSVNEMSFNISAALSTSTFGYVCLMDVQSVPNAGAPNALPVAHAGNDTYLDINQSSASLDGTTSYDSDGPITSVTWSKISGPGQFSIVDPNSALSSVTGLVEGIYQFQLKVADDQGAEAFDTAQIVVGTRVLFDWGATATSSPDGNGNTWNNAANAQPGVKVTGALTTAGNATTLNLEVVNRIDGTFNLAGPGVNTGNTAGDVGDYPNSATTDYAFSHPSTTSGSWKISGLDPANTYTVKFWGTRSVTNSNRIIEIKKSTEAVFQSYNATGNTDFNNAAYFTINGQSEVDFDIRTESQSFFGYINVVDVHMITPCLPTNGSETVTACDSYSWNGLTLTASGSYDTTLVNARGCDSLATLNLTIVPGPTSDAGPDQTINIGNSAFLAGNAGGDFTTFSWSGGTGVFLPDNTTLNAEYIPSPDEILAGTVTLTLTVNSATCGTVTNDVVITIFDPAPVTLYSFNGKAAPNGNLLNWATSMEADNSGFELQRSEDGIRFSRISWIPSKAVNGNSQILLNYSYTDLTCPGNVAYYRLKQLDRNNQFSYSQVVVIRRTKVSQVTLTSLYPNPATEYVRLQLESPISGFVTLRLTDAQGKVLENRRTFLNPGLNTLEWNVARLTSGTYLITLSDETGNTRNTTRFTKR